MKKVLIAADFFSNFELYETKSPYGLKNWVAITTATGEPPELDPDKFKLLGSQDTMTAEEAQKIADETIFVG